ncbi:DUF4038 domain-containing protein [Negadavirga shengliensis]|uniref:DUF4038 domain-containing protein n=1 Tax=Negadavirga shengliensis TaxID=1389218 RepID=A0ABV9T4E8_9BACT
MIPCNNLALSAIIVTTLASCEGGNLIETVGQWTVYEITLQSDHSYDNPYTEVDLYAVFTDEKGAEIRRPGFWDGGNTWKIRFAPPEPDHTYSWETTAPADDAGLNGITGKVFSRPYRGDNALLKKGLLTMSPGKRNVVHHDGSPFLLVGDTPWALPFRGTAEAVKTYAADRQEKGYNAVLLMTVQPDQNAEGPDNRDEDGGFGRGFLDLKDGHLNQLNPEYFQQLDELLHILHEHEIVPVLQPVFQGFGWKGLNALGRNAVPEEYERYTKYLLARYGAMPVMYLVSADGNGKEPGIRETGRMLEEWDGYHQPRGIHYSPADDYVPGWYSGEPDDFYMHHNRSYQEDSWLDFQWCQTGHDGKHLLHKVEKMYHTEPTKASANGEPTYERIGSPDKATGWWQGHEAWSQLMSGGTMGVVYGAAGLWNWKIRTEEPGFDDWSTTEASWEEAIRFEGSAYPGLLGKALKGYNITDMELGHHLTNGKKLLVKEGSFYASYLPEGGTIQVRELKEGLPVVFFNPRTGERVENGKVTSPTQSFEAPDGNPWVLLIGNKRDN